MTKTRLTLHDDYEAFAKYLGIDYEDYVNLQLGLYDEVENVEFDEIEYEVPASV